MKDWQVHVALARREKSMAMASFGRALRAWLRDLRVRFLGVRRKQ